LIWCLRAGTPFLPSIGNWNFAAVAITSSNAAALSRRPRWSDEEVAAGRASDRRAKIRYYGATEAPVKAAIPTGHSEDRRGKSLW
jgi:hypothetical protein